MNMSALMLFRPLEAPLAALHPDLGMDWKLGGGATAVMEMEVRLEARERL